eukprot:9417295-Alexandrium_andersonii.AAC.1
MGGGQRKNKTKQRHGRKNEAGLCPALESRPGQASKAALCPASETRPQWVKTTWPGQQPEAGPPGPL